MMTTPPTTFRVSILMLYLRKLGHLPGLVYQGHFRDYLGQTVRGRNGIARRRASSGCRPGTSPCCRESGSRCSPPGLLDCRRAYLGGGKGTWHFLVDIGPDDLQELHEDSELGGEKQEGKPFVVT